MWWALLACGGVLRSPPAEGDPRDTATPVTTTAPSSLTVLSLNLHCLRTDATGFEDNAARLGAVAEHAAAEGVDVLALQEVCVRPGEDALDLLVGALDAATGETWASEWAFAHVAWEGTADEAEEGVAIVARTPLSERWDLTYFEQAGLTRVALGATVDGTPVVTVHLDHADAPVRLGQSRHTAAHALTVSGTDVILAGDFNDVPGSSTHAAPGLLGFVDASAALADDRIDHVFAHRAGRWGVTSARLVFDGASWPVVSDHPGVLVRFEEQAPAPVTVTRITARVDVGWGHWLTVRGDTAPLDWELGWPMVPVGASEWTLTTTEIEAPFAYKVLVDDIIWQTGDDVAGEPGADNDVVPAFP